MPESVRFFQVDAFTSRRFAGNPAAVVPLGGWLDDATMQAIAQENNLSETAFFVPEPGEADFHLRWFTPTVEVDLCGHATLASAHALYQHMGFERPQARFRTRSGVLTVRPDPGAGGGRYLMDLPALPAEPAGEPPMALIDALGARPSEYLRGPSLLCVFEAKRSIHELRPDFGRLAAVCELTGTGGVVVSAPGASHDVVSRYFAPSRGVNEDPVTGSAHCILTPYWATRLGKNTLNCRQASARGGELFCTLEGERVRMSGAAVTTIEGSLLLE